MKKSIQDRIKSLKDAINPMHAMSGMVKMFIPQLGDTLRMMETSVEEGGILKEGEQKAAFVIVNKGDQTTMAVCVMKKIPEGMLITRTVSDNPLEEILKENS